MHFQSGLGLVVCSLVDSSLLLQLDLVTYINMHTYLWPTNSFDTCQGQAHRSRFLQVSVGSLYTQPSFDRLHTVAAARCKLVSKKEGLQDATKQSTRLRRLAAGVLSRCCWQRPARLPHDPKSQTGGRETRRRVRHILLGRRTFALRWG